MFSAKTIAAILAAASLAAAAPSYYGDNGSSGSGYEHKPESSYTTTTDCETSTSTAGHYYATSAASYEAVHTGVASPPPTYTYGGNPPSKVAPVNPNVVTHRVTAGFNGLNFEPKNIVANVGEIVEVKFLPKNHSFAQSSFEPYTRELE